MTSTKPDKTIDRPQWLPGEVWPHEIRTIHIDGRPVAHTDEGAGDTILLVHDGMWSFIWGRLIERLSRDHRVVTLDFPGSGLSPALGGHASLTADSELLEAFVDRLNLERITLVAHDLGGPVAFGFAARRPELVERLVAMNTFAWPPHRRSLSAMLRLVSSGAVTALDVATGFVFRLTASGSGIGRHLDESEKHAFLASYRNRSARRRFHLLMRSALRETGYLESVGAGLATDLSQKPLLTVFGERNDPFGFQLRFREHFPAAKQMVIPGGNHFPMCDDPDGVAARIADWVKRTG